MKKGTKITLGILTAVGAGVGIYFLGKKLKWWGKSQYDPTTILDPSTGSSGGGGGITWTDDSFPLKKGSKGENVKVVQKYLNSTAGNYKLEVDGYYGQKTADALKKWNSKTEVTKSYFDWIKTQPCCK